MTARVPRAALALKQITLESETHTVLDDEVRPTRICKEWSLIPKFLPYNRAVKLESDTFRCDSIGKSELTLFDNVAACFSIVIIVDPAAKPDARMQESEESDIQTVSTQADEEIDAARCSLGPRKYEFNLIGPKLSPVNVTLCIALQGPFDAMMLFRSGVA